MRFTDEEIRRYSRQMVLGEVGGAGQERLRAATATAQSELEALYLAAAGVGCVRVPSETVAAAVRALNPLVRVEVAPGGAPTAVVDAPVEHTAGDSASRALRFIREALTP